MPKKGEIKNRIGEKWLSCENCWMTIIAYRGALDCDVQFEDHTIVYNRYYDDIKKGYIRNPMYKSVYSTGYLGKGIHLPSLNRKTTKEYVTWQSMIERCYNYKRPSYKGVTVCEEWHNFQNFAEWHKENWKPWMDKNWHLDKDVLKKGNKTYSSENCIFVPRDINMFFIKQIKTRGRLSNRSKKVRK